MSRVHTLDGHPLLIRLAHSEEPLLTRLKDLLVASLFVLPAALAAAAFAGYVLARRALAPVEVMTRQAREITPDKLSARLPVSGDEELRQLAAVFNETLSRLERSFDQLRRFTSDASHELRTPLAMIRSVGEVGLQKDGTREEYRDIVGSMLEEVNRLTSLVDNLLTISRADSGHIQLRRTTIDVMKLAHEAVGLLEVLADEKSVRITVEGPEHVAVDGDSIFLRQALVNLIHNAIKYSPVGEAVALRIEDTRGNVAIEVVDKGPGVPVEDQEKVFDRFYRVDKARWRESGGAGLGLSIAKWVVQAHGGTITVFSNSDGSRFRITLPNAPSGSIGFKPSPRDSKADRR